MTLGGTTFKGTGTFSELQTFTVGLSAGGTTSFTGAVSLASQTVTVGSTTFEGASTFSDGFTSAGVTSFTSAVSLASQTVTLGGTTFKGTGAFVGAQIFSGGLTSSGVSSFTGAIYANAQTITLTDANLKGAFTVSASATFSNGISSGGIITATGVSVTGTVTASGSALISDRRYKKNITSISNTSTIEGLLNLRPVFYDWRRDEFPKHNFDSFTHYGFIAQEVEEVMPELVGSDENGWKTLRYIDVIPLLVKSFQIQQDELKVQEERILSLESKFGKVVEEMAALERDRPHRRLNLEEPSLSPTSDITTFAIILLLVALVVLKATELVLCRSKRGA